MLLGAAAILVLGAVAVCGLYLHNNSELRTLQMQAQALNNRQAAVNSLVSDVLKYSETHRDIEPLLESIGVTNKAPAKPVTPK